MFTTARQGGSRVRLTYGLTRLRLPPLSHYTDCPHDVQLGHYHGLLHTFQGGCEAPINDGVTDTAPNMDFGNANLPWNLSSAVAWCDAFRKGQSPSVDLLKAFKSCPGTAGMDSVFNLMSYIPGRCGFPLSSPSTQQLPVSWRVHCATDHSQLWCTGKLACCSQRSCCYILCLTLVFDCCCSCRMVFTENQVARMQWAILTYMPDMMRRYSVK